jgi:hypothetical protein
MSLRSAAATFAIAAALANATSGSCIVTASAARFGRPRWSHAFHHPGTDGRTRVTPGLYFVTLATVDGARSSRIVVAH